MTVTTAGMNNPPSPAPPAAFDVASSVLLTRPQPQPQLQSQSQSTEPIIQPHKGLVGAADAGLAQNIVLEPVVDPPAVAAAPPISTTASESSSPSSPSSSSAAAAAVAKLEQQSLQSRRVAVTPPLISTANTTTTTSNNLNNNASSSLDLIQQHSEMLDAFITDSPESSMKHSHLKRNQSGSATSSSAASPSAAAAAATTTTGKSSSKSKSAAAGATEDDSSIGSALDAVDENNSIASANEYRHSGSGGGGHPVDKSGGSGSGVFSLVPAPGSAPPSAPSSATSSKPPKRQKSEKEVLVGTPVKEGHVNYMLMYDMLTGIRISVSRCNSKPPRPVEDSDYLQAHKLAFDETGKELTPKSEYDFKFKDYAPWVFKNIRDSFMVDPAEYLLSLTGKYVLSELGSPGKSGSFFYFSSDYRFIIKTIHHNEHKFMRKKLPQYYNHIQNNPHTLLSRILGLHRVKLPGNKKIHFVVMGNVFPPNKDIHEVYDLKGSTVGRAIGDDEIKNNPRAVMKDLNWIAKNKTVNLGPAKRMPFCEQIERDVAYLKEQNIMDYSLLIGIHDMIKGNKEHIREKSLSVFEPAILDALPKPPTKKKTRRRIRTTSDPINLTPSASKLPEFTPEERRHVIFYQDAGGFQGTDESDRPLPVIYYLGIIDIFTSYNTTKKLEHFFRSITNDSKKISAIRPRKYGERFFKFIQDSLNKVI